MNRLYRWIFSVFLVATLFFVPHAVLALEATPVPCFSHSPNGVVSNCIIVDQSKLGFKIPALSNIFTFALRMVFVIGGILALFYLLMGAFAWITSGGEKDAIGKAQAKIQAAILGVILIAVMLAVVVTLEQVVFQKTICFGLSCPITIPSLLTPSDQTPTAPAQIIATPTPYVATSSPQLIDATITPSIPANASPYITLSPEPTFIIRPEQQITHPYK